jgi:hypothetical protein
MNKKVIYKKLTKISTFSLLLMFVQFVLLVEKPAETLGLASDS